MPPKGSNKKPPPPPPTTMLSSFGRDLTAAAQSADPVVGREDEIDRVVCILSRKSKNSAVLVGAPGVGKTAIAEGLAPAARCRGSSPARASWSSAWPP